jgi:hypothetical protein
MSSTCFSISKSFQGRIFTQFGGEDQTFLCVIALYDCLSTTTTFDLWMSIGAHDVFALVVNFINANWQLNQIIIGLFGAIEITSQAMAMKLQALLDKYNLWKKILLYVKDEGSNVGAMTTLLMSQPHFGQSGRMQLPLPKVET